MENKERNVLRELAREYKELSMEERNAERRELHRKVNDLKSSRPIVLIDDLPWHEFDDMSLKLISKDLVMRSAEDFLRKRIYQYKHFPADMVLLPFIPVKKIVESTGIGVKIEEEILSTESENNIVAHAYFDQFSQDDDLQKLVMPIISYNKAETDRRLHILEDTFGDIINVRPTGIGHIHVVTWDKIAEFRGVTPLLIDLIDRPEFSHRLVRKLTDIMIHTMNQYEELGLLDTEEEHLHCTAIATGDLPKCDEDGKVRLKNIWGRGAAQILASVSKEMRNDFDIEYMKETIGRCGLSYYGCCEPLDTMIDIVEKIPNLRKIGVTPWANVNNACEIIGDRYVVSSKPNPSLVATKNLDVTHLQKELGDILGALKQNNCHADITLKDVSTFSYNPKNMIEWEKVAMDMVMNY